jgi:hypothetical protein
MRSGRRAAGGALADDQFDRAKRGLPALGQQLHGLFRHQVEQLADRDGRHIIPYTGRVSIGSMRRRIGGTDAAPFPQQWFVEPNRADRANDIVPDGGFKQKLHAQGKAFLDMPILGQGRNRVNVLAAEMQKLQEKKPGAQAP